MVNKNKYRRCFFIFGQEDRGYGAGQEPSGHVKIEVKDGKGILTATVQNLKEDEKTGYKLYIVKTGGTQTAAISVGDIKLKRSRAEVTWNFDPEDVEQSGLPIDSFDVMAVLVENERSKNGIICPIAAYRDTKVEWREAVRKVLCPDGNINRAQDAVPKEQDIYSKYENVLESRYEKRAEPEKKEEKPPRNPVYDVGGEEQADEAYYEDSFVTEKLKDMDVDNGEKIKAEAAKIFEKLEEERESSVENNEVKKDNTEERKTLPIEGDMSGKQNNAGAGAGEVKDGCSSYSSLCRKNYGGSACNPCTACHAFAASKQENGKSGAVVNIESLKKTFSVSFEACDPFGSKRKDYQWWKVVSPVQLNNILYQNNVRVPLLFNPKVMMAHFKYRYLIVGIYSDRITRRDFVVCGVPGVYGIDDKPFGDFCRWVQVEGNRPKYGAFGYWLVYINPRTGEFLGLR